jgi:hypothetical protein
MAIFLRVVHPAALAGLLPERTALRVQPEVLLQAAVIQPVFLQAEVLHYFVYGSLAEIF